MSMVRQCDVCGTLTGHLANSRENKVKLDEESYVVKSWIYDKTGGNNIDVCDGCYKELTTEIVGRFTIACKEAAV